jgi:hypothetical protein
MAFKHEKPEGGKTIQSIELLFFFKKALTALRGPLA